MNLPNILTGEVGLLLLEMRMGPKDDEICFIGVLAYLTQRQIQDFPKGGAWGVVAMDISYLDIL